MATPGRDISSHHSKTVCHAGVVTLLAVIAPLILETPAVAQCHSSANTADVGGGSGTFDSQGNRLVQHASGYWWNGYECTSENTPIIISTRHGAAYELTPAADGVLFDLDADGVPEQVAWTQATSELAFLAVDRNGDGQITSGSELFGNRTFPGALNGFDALARMAMATNGGQRRGSVSSDDPLFERLLLWTDRNHNGVSEPSELRPASDVLSDIGLGYSLSRRRDEFGNIFLYKGWVHVRTKRGRNEARSQDENEARTRPAWDIVLLRQQ